VSERLIALDVLTRGPAQPLPPSRYRFPDPTSFPAEGLVAAGGDFAPATIVEAYRTGTFPWPHPSAELLWFSPDPRSVIEPDGLHVSRRLARTLRQGRFRATVDAAFERVIRACAVRPEDEGSWITERLIRGYLELHDLGWAHSVETWTPEGELAGGLYGVAVGAMFGAESMFHAATDASKAAMVAMMQHARDLGLAFVDIQVITPHTASMGAHEIPRAQYLLRLRKALEHDVRWG